MSIKGAEILNNLEELSEKEIPNINDLKNIESLDYLNIQNNYHMKMLSSIKSNLAKEISMSHNNENQNIVREKIKYKSSLKIEKLNKLLNLDIFNNIPSNKSLELLNQYQQKNQNLLKNIKNKNSKNDLNKKNNFSNIDNKDNDDDRFNVNSYFDKKNKIKNNFNNSISDQNKNKSQDKYVYSGGYMDIRPVNGKKKKFNSPQDDDNDDEENNGTYSNYTNSIYNINKRKRNNRRNKYNDNEDENEEDDESNYNNKKKTYNNNYNKRKYKNRYNNIDDEDEDNNQNNSRQIGNNSGFVSAITITNAVFKNKISNSYVEKLESNNNNSNNNSNNNNSLYEGGRKKFVPPTKNKNKNNSNSNSANKNKQQSAISKVLINNPNLPKLDESKQLELEEKLKGFDEKMIEFIQSEILSSSPDVHWDDIAGLEFAKKTIKEIIIWPMLRPDLFNGIRRPPKGLLLFGPPGTGKTMIAKAIASQSKSMFFNISASSLMSKWIGESEKLVRTLFALASFYQPSVVFIDEIDSLLTSRSENENEASRRIKTEFLVQLDGAGTNIEDRILIIGATNRPQEIDDAFVRRLSKRLYIPLPNKISRKQLIMRVLEKERKNNNKYDITDADIDDIISKTKGYSGSDLINVCKEAAMMPIRSIEDISNCQLEHLRGVNKNDFDEALFNVKPSINEKSIEQYVEWNKNFGSFQFEDKDE